MSYITDVSNKVEAHMISIREMIEILQIRNGTLFTEDSVKNAIMALGFADESGNYRYSEMMLYATFVGQSHLSQIENYCKNKVS